MWQSNSDKKISHIKYIPAWITLTILASYIFHIYLECRKITEGIVYANEKIIIAHNIDGGLSVVLNAIKSMSCHVFYTSFLLSIIAFVVFACYIYKLTRIYFYGLWILIVIPLVQIAYLLVVFLS